MGRLTAGRDPGWPREACPMQRIRDQVTYWREHLLEVRLGTSALTLDEVMGQVDRWLDEYLDRRGR